MHSNFKRFMRGAIPSLMVLAGVVVDMNRAEAIPAFARQTSQACTACHTQHFPTLNSFGRMFKAQGYTMGGSQESVVGDGLNLPGVLNAALVGRMAIEQTKDKSGKTAKGIGFPASLSLYFGGRIGENSGFLMEVPFEGAKVVNATPADSNKPVDFKPDAGPSIAQLGSLKWNYVKDIKGVNAGLNAYTSSMAGPSYGYELLSTGAMGMNVAITGANAMGAIGMHMEHGSTLMGAFMGSMSAPSNPMMKMRMNMAGPSTGLGASAQGSEWFVYYSAYFGAQAMDTVPDPSFAHYLRAVWMPSFAGWDLGVGTQIYAGSFAYAGGNEYDAKANTFDFQAQGDIAGMATGLYITYARAPKSDGGKLNWYNFSEGGANASYAVLYEMEVISRLSLNVGYTNATYWVDKVNKNTNMVMSSNDLKGTLTQLGANYLLAPNKRLGFKYASFGGADLDSTVAELDLTIGF